MLFGKFISFLLLVTITFQIEIVVSVLLSLLVNLFDFIFKGFEFLDLVPLVVDFVNTFCSDLSVVLVLFAYLVHELLVFLVVQLLFLIFDVRGFFSFGIRFQNEILLDLLYVDLLSFAVSFRYKFLGSRFPPSEFELSLIDL